MNEDEHSGRGLVPSDPPPLGEGVPAEFDPTNPLAVSAAFVECLNGYDVLRFRQALLNFTTPESHAAWGDFTEVRDRIAGLDFYTGVDYALGDDLQPVRTVAYVRLLELPASAYEGRSALRVDGDVLVDGALTITLAWRGDIGWWQVHSVGLPASAADVPTS
jgi:hypothetical protein